MALGSRLRQKRMLLSSLGTQLARGVSYAERAGLRTLLSPGSGSNIHGKDEEAWEQDISDQLLQVLVQ